MEPETAVDLPHHHHPDQRREVDEVDEEDGDEAVERDDVMAEEDLAALKKELTMTKRTLRAKEEEFAKKLKEARGALSETSARDLVLGIFRSDLDAIFLRYATSHRQELVAAFETWWDKYRVTLTSIEHDRDAAAQKLHELLGGLGYGV